MTVAAHCSHRAKSRRVLQLIPFLWSGAGGVVTHLCTALAREKQVMIATTGHFGALCDWPSYRRRLRDAGVEWLRLDLFQRDSETFWDSVARLRDLLENWKPDLVHAHAGVSTCAAALARDQSRHQPPLLGQMYSWGVGRPAWMNWMDAWGFSRADRVVCSAWAYADTLRSLGVPWRKIVYLPWGIPLPARKKDAAREKTMGAPIIGFVGRIEPRKGQLDLVKAFHQVLRHIPEAILEMIGPVADEAYESTIRAYLERHGLTSSVRICGYVRKVDVRVRSWAAFVSLSRDEGQGLAAIEAMALGVPVAALPVAGVADYLQDGITGFSLGSAAPTAVAARLIKMLRSQQQVRAVALRAERLVRRRYDWANTLLAFNRLYRELKRD